MAARAQTAILIAGLALLAGSGGVALWLMRAPAPPLDVVGPEPAQRAPPSAPSPPSELAPPPAPAPAAVAPKRDSIESTAIDDGPRLDVQLLLEADGRAASGAMLHVLGPREQQRWNYREDFERFGLGLEFLTRHGRVFAADAQGRTSVPFLPGTLQLIAVRGEQFGMSSFELRSLPDAPLEVLLRPAASVEVRVRREGDRLPVAGVAVLATRLGGRDAPIGALSDKQGRVRLWPLFEDPNLASRWSASIEGILREPVSSSFGPSDAAAGIELSLPRTGAVQFQLQGRQGEALELAGSLVLQWKDAEGDWALPQEIAFSQGSLSLPLVELGVLVHVRAVIEGVAERPVAKFQLEGPALDTTRVVLALTQAVPLVRARLLDAEGSALGFADVEGDLSIWRAGESLHSSFETRTRADGQLTVAFQGLELGSSTAAIVLRADRRQGRAFLGGVFHSPMQSETTQLGELRLEPPQRLFAGRVLDASEEPRADAFLLLVPAKHQGGIAAGIAMNARSDGAGRFELLGWSEDGLFEIEAQHGSSSGRALVRRGDLDVQIRLR